ncbi:MAG: hypothetical protein WBA67_03465 [Jannaschia sp.]
MTNGLPPYYFRVKDNGALVFRVDAENRQRRLELDQIATVNINNGQVKAQGDTVLTAEDETAINDWITARSAELAAREVDDIERAVDHLNLTAQWVQAKATDAQLDAVTDRLLLAMHDLRTVLVKKRADRLLGE